jgi:hypothetical protein
MGSALEIFKATDRFIVRAGWERQEFPRAQLADAVDALYTSSDKATLIAVTPDGEQITLAREDLVDWLVLHAEQMLENPAPSSSAATG